ncbi:MAG: hypothetical protein CMJ18_05715 [Phycisphaeraceae bacterium]|nr:hypothetical protein [Phycisphaeraceae bacterium]
MDDRKRFISALTFDAPDRVPFEPGRERRSTVANWHRQGLPRDVKDTDAYIRRLLGMPPASLPPDVSCGVITTMIPEFEEKVIEQRRDSKIVQDWKGNICEIGKAFSPADLGGVDFVTRTWLRCPVASRDDWPGMARRYDPDDPARFPVDFHDRARRLRDRRVAVGVTLSGPFWQLREWLGFEALCMLLIDDPDFAQQMIDFWRDFIARMLEMTFAHFVPDYVMINEDMAYKQKPMISPAMCRRFLVPCWRCWGQIIRNAGVPVYGVDSDGHIGQLIPVWLEADVNWTTPLEVAAGNDLPAYRRTHGGRIAYSGGVDKRAIAAGGDVIRREIDRLRPVIDAGGYIPGCDHGVPSDVTWPDFVEYCRLLAGATGWL